MNKASGNLSQAQGNLFLKVHRKTFEKEFSNGNNYFGKTLNTKKSATKVPNCWKSSENNVAIDFFQNTSLHGLRYVGMTKLNIYERVFWFLTFLAGLITATILIYGVFDLYRNNPIIISFFKSETTVYQIPFPAVTICNVNYLRKTKVEQYKRLANGNLKDEATKEAIKKLHYVNQICSAEPTTMTQKFGFTTKGTKLSKELLEKVQLDKNENQQSNVNSFLMEAAQSCEEMILLCLWKGSQVNCSEIFHEIDTDYGKCCTFNMIPKNLLNRFENESKYSPDEIEIWKKGKLDIDSLLLESRNDIEVPAFPRRIRRAGKPYGLSLILDPELEEYYCTASDSVGFQLITHLPIEIPQIANFGLGISPNFEVFINVFPDVTTAESFVHEFDVDKRECYFYNEYSLQYYNYYTVANCIDECITNLVYKNCGCVLYNMPRNDSRNLCKPSKFQCTNDIIRNYSSTSSQVQCSKCLPTCTQISYLTQSTVTPLKDPNFWISSDDNKPPSWVSKNVSMIHVYFGQDTVYPKIRKSLYGLTELIANTGGLLGLCLGFSALSGIEFIYYFTVRLFCKNKL